MTGQRTVQDYFWALAVAGAVYLVLQLLGIGNFLSYLIAASAFSWALKTEKDEQGEQAESMIRPRPEFRDVKRLEQVKIDDRP